MSKQLCARHSTRDQTRCELPVWQVRVVDKPVSSSAHRQARKKGRAPAAKPSVTILIAGTQRRGAEVFGERLAAGLVEKGWRTELIALAATALPDSPRVAAAALSDKSAAQLGRLDWGTVRSLRRNLRQSRPDVLLAFGSSTLQFGVAATVGMRHRPAVAYVSIGEPLYWARRRHQKLAYRFLLGMVDLVLAVSVRTAEQLSGGLGIKSNRVRVVHTGVPSSLLEVERPGPSAKLRIIFVGSLSPEKDPMLALEAVGRVAAKVPSDFRIIGAGPLETTLREEIDRMKLRSTVQLMGSIEDVAPHLAWADILLLTSRTEGLPAVTLEAAAVGTTVVAFDVGGVAETMLDGMTGRLVKPGDVEGLVDGMLFYADDLQARRSAGEAGKWMVKERFTIETSVRNFHATLSDLLQGSPSWWRR
jgi:glycosyltransferase involved in cell wall biosynthesis